MRILSDTEQEQRTAFESGRSSATYGALSPTGARRGRDDIVRIAILVATVLVIALVWAIITVSLRAGQPIDVVGGADPSDEALSSADALLPSQVDGDLQGAAMFATQFAHTYLNFTDGDPAKRAATLRPFLAPGLDPQLGWSGQGSQAAGVLMPLDAVRDGDGITVTVAALVSGSPYSRWVYLAVPLAEDDDGRLAVVATPSYVPPPPPADVAALDLPDVDEDLSASLRPLVAAAMQAYGADATVSISGITAPEARIAGLGGLYTLSGLDALIVAEGDGSSRTAIAEVSWDDAAIGGTIVQAYEIQLRRLDGAWLVEAIGPR